MILMNIEIYPEFSSGIVLFSNFFLELLSYQVRMVYAFVPKIKPDLFIHLVLMMDHLTTSHCQFLTLAIFLLSRTVY